MTAVDRPDNGQDKGREPDGSWIRDELRRAKDRSEQVPPWARPVITRPAVPRTTSTASGRAGAGEQQRERVEALIRRYNTGKPSWSVAEFADELLAMLGGPQPDGEARQHRMDADCWCQPVRHPSGAWDHQ